MWWVHFLQHVYTLIRAKPDNMCTTSMLAPEPGPKTSRMQHSCLPPNITMRDNKHLICTISSVYVTCQRKKVVRSSIFLFEISVCCSQCDVKGAKLTCHKNAQHHLVLKKRTSSCQLSKWSQILSLAGIIWSMLERRLYPMIDLSCCLVPPRIPPSDHVLIPTWSDSCW